MFKNNIYTNAINTNKMDKSYSITLYLIMFKNYLYLGTNLKIITY